VRLFHRLPAFSSQLFVCLCLAALTAAGQQVAIDKSVWAPEAPNDLDPGLRGAPDPDCVLQNADGCVRALFRAEKDGKSGFIDNTGKVVVPLQFNEVFGFSEGLAAVTVGRKFGFVDASGNLVIPPSWEFAHLFHQGLAAVSDGKKYGFIDKTGKLVIPLQFAEVGNFHEGLAAVRIAPSKANPRDPRAIGALGYIDIAGRMVIAPADRGLSYPPVTEGRVPFQVDHKWGAMDTSGKIVIEPQYPNELEFSLGHAVVFINGKDGLIDTDGKMAVPAIYERIGKFSDGLAAVRTDGKWGFVDTSGQIVIPAQFDRVEPFRAGYAAVIDGGKWGIIDKAGKAVIPPQFEASMTCPTAKDPSAISRPRAPQFFEGLAAVSVQCKSGFVDIGGRMVIPATYEEVRDFSEGLAAAKSGGKWGFIDKSGQFVVHAQYDNALAFSGGLARVYIEIKNGFQTSLIDKSGKLVWGPETVKGPSPWLMVPLVVLCPMCVA
jgi:hypothetical protein